MPALLDRVLWTARDVVAAQGTARFQVARLLLLEALEPFARKLSRELAS